MRIMQVIPAFSMGGGETMCENLIYELRRFGHNVLAVSLYSEETLITKRLKNNGVRVVFLNKKNGVDFSLIIRLRKLIKKYNPDVIHTHLYALKYAYFSKLFLNIKGVHTVHNVAEKEASRFDQKINLIIYHLKSFVPVSLSKEVQQTVIELYKLRKNYSPVVFNGINLKKCLIKKDYSLNSPVRIIHVGRFSEQKNHNCIINSLLHLSRKKFHIDFWGEGELKNSIEEMVNKNGLADEVSFKGMTDNIYNELYNADLFILPSKWEGMPMSIIEAMGTGLPIIASNVGGIPDMLVNEESALLIEPTVVNVCDSILKLCENNELRKSLGNNALKKATIFSATQMASAYIRIYKNIVS